MKSNINILVKITAVVIFCVMTMTMQVSHAQSGEKLGWLEGVVVTSKGGPAADFCMGDTSNGAYVILHGNEGRKEKVATDIALGGYFSFRDVQPGVYELFVEKTEQCYQNRKILFRPQHIFGITIEPGKRMRLDVTVKEGSDLEEVGAPVIETKAVIIVSDQIERLQAEIVELREMLQQLGSESSSTR